MAYSQAVPRNMVCLEIITSVLCTYCPGSAKGADDLISHGWQVAAIEDHSLGMGTDAYSNVGARSRETLYFAGSNGYPTAMFDGCSAFVGGNHTTSMYTSYLPKYNARMAVNSPLDMAMTFTNTGLHYDITVTVTNVDTLSATNLKLFVFVTESNIVHSWEGLNILNFVNRAMIPDQNGTTVDFTSGNTQTYDLSVDLDPSWVASNCEFIATVQNMDAAQGTVSNGGSTMRSRQQYQTIKSGVIPLTANFSADKDSIDVNTTVHFTSSASGGYVNAPQTYSWSFPGATPAASTDTNPAVIYTETGSHDVTLVINRGGETQSMTKTNFIKVNFGVGIKEQAGNQINVSPNPSNGTFRLTFNLGKSIVADLSIVNSAGKTVFSESNVSISNDLTKTIRTVGLPSGEYFLTLKNGDTNLIKKILIN